jgi:hypothetical protein
MKTTITTLVHTETKEIDDKIREILSRGKIVRFTNVFIGITKDVREWNQDDMGDFTAFRRSGGQTDFVCPYSTQYEISEVDE